MRRLFITFLLMFAFACSFAQKQVKVTIEGKASRADIEELLMPKLSEVLSETQKKNKITNLLASLRRAGVIRQGENRMWFLVKA